MKRPSSVVPFAVLFSAVLILTGSTIARTDAAPDPQRPEYVGGEVIVKLRKAAGPSQAAALAGEMNAVVKKQMRFVGAELWTLSGISVEDAVTRYSGDPRIEYIEPNYLWYVDDTFPDDTGFGQLWGMHNTGQTGGIPDVDIDAPGAWDFGTGDSTVVVGVIDTGVDYNHEDLAANMWVNPGEIAGNGIDDDGNGFIDDIHGWDFANDDNDPMDGHGHGTHVSGTIGAVGNNGAGVTGVCWRVRIVAIKFLTDGGSGSTSDAVDCVEYATKVGVRLTNNSWGGGPFSTALRDAIAQADTAGILFVAAAGNDATDNDVLPHYPSNYTLDNVISVANITAWDQLSSLSNWGATSVDLAAPGSGIVSTLPGNNYGSKSGTSMASPHVAGAAALVWSVSPGLSHDDVKAAIMASVDTTAALKGRMVSGGRLNVSTALSQLDSIPPARIADLAVLETGSSAVTLGWTATGDDSTAGAAYRYDIRYATFPIDAASFEAASPFDGVPAPQPAGSPEAARLSGLDFNTPYYFAMKAFDENDNASAVSNAAFTTTLGVPALSYSPAAIADTLLNGGRSTHTVTIRNTGAGVLDFEFTNVLDQLDPGYIPWIFASPYAGSVAAGDSALVELTLDATGLPGGFHSAAAGLASNDPAWPLSTVEARVWVVDAPDIRLVPAVLSFGPRYKDVAVSDTVTVVNQGTTTLSVTSVTTDHADYTVTSSPFTVAPGQVRALVVTFRPSSLSIVDAVLSVDSDDPDTPVATMALLGQGVEAPDISVTPSLLVEALRTGETASRTLTIANEGGADLDWRISVVDSASAAVASSTLTPPAAGASPEGYEKGHPPVAGVSMRTGPVTAVLQDLTGVKIMWELYRGVFESAFWSTIVADVVSRGAVVEENRAPITPELLHDYDVVWINETAMWTTAEIAAIQNWISAGGALLVESDESSNVYNLVLAGTGLSFDPANASGGLTTAIHPHPATEGVGSVFASNPLAHISPPASPALAIVDDTAGKTIGAAAEYGGGRIAVFSDEMFPDAVIAAADNQLLGNQVIDWLAKGVPWLKPSPVTGTVPGYSSEAVTVEFDATGIGGGTHEADIVVESNDPFDPETRTHAVLVVTPAPDIRIVAAVTDFGDVFVGGSRTDTVYVANDGVENLLVTHVLIDNTSYTVTPAAVTVAPGGVKPMAVTFTPARAGTVAAVMSIVSNDPDESVVEAALTGRGLLPPEVAISPAAILDNLLTGARREHEITVTNNGVSDLEWSLDVSFALPADDWLRVSTAGNVTRGGETDTVGVILDAEGLAGGTHTAAATFYTNDPRAATVTVPVVIGVTDAPDIGVSADTVEFGVVFTSVTRSKTFTVFNRGTRALVVNAIDLVNGTGFGVSPRTFSLAPLAAREVTVTFTPVNEDPHRGTLEIRTNDPDEPSSFVRLFGTGLYPPEISLPALLSENLYTGETAVQQFEVGNTGRSPLWWRLDTQSPAEATVELKLAPDGVERSPADGAGPPPADLPRAAAETVELRDLSGVRILYDRSHGQIDITALWSYIRADLIARGAEVTVNTVPVTAAMIGEYDVYWSTDMNGSFSNDELNILSSWVALGGGLVLEGDNTPTVNEFNRLLTRLATGITMTATAGAPGSTGIIHQHPATRDIQSIYLSANLAHISSVAYPAGRLVDDVAGVPAAAWSTVGSGRVVVVADEVFADDRAAMPDNRRFANQVFDWLVPNVRWLVLDNSAGETPPDSARAVTATFNAAGLAGGDYDALIVATSNDPVTPAASIPVHFHVEAAPDIVVSATSLEFGEVFTGQSAALPLYVANEGSDDLVVLSSTDDGDYRAAPDTMTLAPGVADTLWVTLSPSREDSIPGVLRLASNDPDEAVVRVQLYGAGLLPPVVAVSPDSLVQALDWGSVAERLMFVSNTGANILAWRVDVFDAGEVAFREYTLSPPASFGVPQKEPGSAGSPAPLAQENAGVVVAELEDLSGINIMYDQAHGQRGNSAWSTMVFDLSSRGAYVFPSHIPVTPQRLSAVDVLWLTDMALPFFESEKTAIVAWLRRGGGILFEGDDVTSVEYFNDLLEAAGSGVEFTDADGTPGYTTQIRVHETTRDIHEIFLSENMARLLPTSGYASVVINDAGGRPNTAADLIDVGRIVAAADELFENYRMATSQNRLFGNQVFDWLAGAAEWLSVAPAAGTTAAGATDTLTVTFDGRRTVPGLHHGVLRTVSNDPVNPYADVTALFDLAGIPVIAVTDTLLDFGDVVTGMPVSLPLGVSNTGFEPLHVTSVEAEDPFFSADSSGIVVLPLESGEVTVTMMAAAAGSHAGTLLIVSDDPARDTVTVALRGTARTPPAIALSPDSLFARLTTGETKIDTVFVYNTAAAGAADLRFSASVEPPAAAWLQVDTAVVTVAPGDNAGVAVAIDASGLFGGVYDASVLFAANVPGVSVVPLPVELVVEGVPSLAVLDTLVEYGSAYIGFPATRPVRLMNAGTDLLVVTAIEFDDPWVSAQPGSLAVAPGETRPVAVTLLPAAAGPWSAAMTVTSNDPTSPGPHGRLTATVYPPPAAAITPDSMHVTIDDGAAGSYPFRLANEGPGDLYWNARVVDRPLSGAAADGAAVPGAVLFHGTHMWGGINDWSLVIDDLRARGGVVDQSNDAISHALLAGYDVLWLGDRTTLVPTAEMQAVADWVMAGGTLLVEADYGTAIETYSTLLGRMSAGINLSSSAPAGGETDRIFPHPATTGIDILYAGTPQCRLALTGGSGRLAESSDGKVIAAFAEPGGGRVIVCADQFFVNAFVERADNRAFATRVFAWLAGGDWIALEPASGTVAPSESVTLDLTIDTGLIQPGHYDMAIRLESNDPATPVLTVPLPVDVVEVVIATVDVDLEAGLNLRSWNVDTPADTTLWLVAPVLPELRSVRGFDGGGLVFDPAIPPQFNTLVTMDHLHGYWINVRNDATLPVTGRRVDRATPIPLRAGYNLVGYLPQEADSVGHALASVVDKVQVVMGYDGGGLTWDPSIPPQFNSLQVLTPSFGYWVRLTVADTLVYPSPVAVPPAIAAAQPGAQVAARAVAPAGTRPGVTAAAGQTGAAGASLSTRSREWIGVWGDGIEVGGEAIAAGTVVTALDPDGVVCGEFTVIRPGELGMMAIYRDDPETKADEGANPGDPVTIVLSPTPEDAGDPDTGTGEIVFEGFTWSSYGDVVEFGDVARMSPTAVTTAPATTGLHQNYPNPFNPVTTIAYDLHAPVHVDLVVYSVRGERIRHLVARWQGAGRYTVTWQGVNDAGVPVATGVYFYKLVAGDYVSTRKMILLK